MAKIVKEYKYWNDTTIEVLQYVKDEYSYELDEPEILILNMDSYSGRFTPDDLIALGIWITKIGKEVKEKYTPKGTKKRKSKTI